MLPSMDPTRLKHRVFRIKKLQYNTYEVQHQKVKGHLRLINIPVTIAEIPREHSTQNTTISDLPPLMVAAQPISSFVNRGDKNTPSNVSMADLNRANKIDITNHILQDESYEPWNEFILAGSPPTLVRTRTILTKLEWLPDHNDMFGDPSLLTSHNTMQSVSLVSAVDSSSI